MGSGFSRGSWTSKIEVDLAGVQFGEELAATREIFQIKELIFFQAMTASSTPVSRVRRRANPPAVGGLEAQR
jgi:hypothetical protein